MNIIRTLRPASTGVTPRLPDTLHALIRRLGLFVTRPTSRGKRGGLRKQRVIQTRITHRFDVVPRAVKAASANVSQLINMRVIKHRERGIPLTICCLNAQFLSHVLDTQRVTLLAVCFKINLTKPDSVRQPVTFRKLRDICIPEFIKDLTPILNDTDRPLNELVHAYTTEIEAVVDKHAPVQRKSITLRPNAQ